MNEIKQQAFEDESTIHFGGDGEEIDFFVFTLVDILNCFMKLIRIADSFVFIPS